MHVCLCILLSRLKYTCVCKCSYMCLQVHGRPENSLGYHILDSIHLLKCIILRKTFSLVSSSPSNQIWPANESQGALPVSAPATALVWQECWACQAEPECSILIFMGQVQVLVFSGEAFYWLSQLPSPLEDSSNHELKSHFILSLNYGVPNLSDYCYVA